MCNVDMAGADRGYDRYVATNGDRRGRDRRIRRCNTSYDALCSTTSAADEPDNVTTSEISMARWGRMAGCRR